MQGISVALETLFSLWAPLSLSSSHALWELKWAGTGGLCPNPPHSKGDGLLWAWTQPGMTTALTLLLCPPLQGSVPSS